MAPADLVQRYFLIGEKKLVAKNQIVALLAVVAVLWKYGIWFLPNLIEKKVAL